MNLFGILHEIQTKMNFFRQLVFCLLPFFSFSFALREKKLDDSPLEIQKRAFFGDTIDWIFVRTNLSFTTKPNHEKLGRLEEKYKESVMINVARNMTGLRIPHLLSRIPMKSKFIEFTRCLKMLLKKL